ncbi:MAG: 16S rRNA (cytidine(1402)-2'-O)-methyltransferase [Spirochaetaceae bacterium]|jgi:16S rRNA (cytidine1402-2'-O)-methyltransferase|nr:16S rRNA (cytidine(1402)-2'-O)-methyltransferase [Spirochaetaceae bacterium]
MAASLFMVATPIGNLGDISFRALETLKSAALIACEDTRRTAPLLTHFGIAVKLLSCRQANESQAGRKVIEVLSSGFNVAYVSDAGSPALSDPGAVLANMVSDAGYPVVPIPGASAFSTLISAAGVRDKTVVFEGFLSPRAGRRKTRLLELLDFGAAFVLYESPFRVLKLFEDLSLLGGGRYCCVGREMTKLHEEYLRGSVCDVYGLLLKAEKQRGEFTVLISGR